MTTLNRLIDRLVENAATYPFLSSHLVNPTWRREQQGRELTEFERPGKMIEMLKPEEREHLKGARAEHFKPGWFYWKYTYGR